MCVRSGVQYEYREAYVYRAEFTARGRDSKVQSAAWWGICLSLQAEQKVNGGAGQRQRRSARGRECQPEGAGRFAIYRLADTQRGRRGRRASQLSAAAAAWNVSQSPQPKPRRAERRARGNGAECACHTDGARAGRDTGRVLEGVCVCVCVCVSNTPQGGRAGKREGGKQKGGG